MWTNLTEHFDELKALLTEYDNEVQATDKPEDGDG